MKGMIKLFGYFDKRDWAMIAVAFCLIILQVYLDLELPGYMSEITMLIETPGNEMSEVLTAGAYMLGCAIGSMIAAVITGYFVAKVGANIAKRLRGEVFSKTLSFSAKEIDKFSTPSLITRTTNDITQIQMLIVFGMQVIIKAPILAVWAICKILDKSFEWSVVTAVAVVILIIMMSIVLFVVIPKTKRIQGLTDDINRVTRENLTGIRVVRAYNAEDYQEKKFEEVNDDLTGVNLFVNRSMSVVMPSMNFMMSMLSASIYIVGAALISNAIGIEKLVLFSDMMVFSSYAMLIIMSFLMLSMAFLILPRAYVATKRVMEVLSTENSIIDGTETEPVKGKEGEVVFDNVSFTYPGSENSVLSNMSFKASKGETIAFIGSTGCGKSTIMNMIIRFYDVTDGAVYVGGRNVKDYEVTALRGMVGYISQKSVLFSGTVSSNVTFGDSDESDVKRAIEIAQGKEFVESMSEKYDSHISQGGSNVSGGQKQRLSIARAVYRNPEIYIFDDSFSALDYKTDKNLRKALKDEVGDSTIFIVAQRIGTIRDADRIVVVDDGKIVGIGTHDELIRNCSTYIDIAYSQLSEEELL